MIIKVKFVIFFKNLVNSFSQFFVFLFICLFALLILIRDLLLSHRLLNLLFKIHDVYLIFSLILLLGHIYFISFLPVFFFIFSNLLLWNFWMNFCEWTLDYLFLRNIRRFQINIRLLDLFYKLLIV